MEFNGVLLSLGVGAAALAYFKYAAQVKVDPNQQQYGNSNRQQQSNGSNSNNSQQQQQRPNQRSQRHSNGPPSFRPPPIPNSKQPIKYAEPTIPGFISGSSTLNGRSNQSSPNSRHGPTQQQNYSPLPPPSSFQTTPRGGMHAVYDDQWKTRMDTQVTEILDVVTGGPAEGWVELHDHQFTDIDIARKQLRDTDIPVMRASCELDAPPLWCLEAVTQFMHRARIEPDFKDGRVIQQFDEFSRVEYVEHDRQWPAQPRDFTLIQYVRFLSPNTNSSNYINDNPIAVVYCSADHPQAPERPGYVRAYVNLNGWLLRPIRVHGKLMTSVMYTTQIDPRGNLPTAVLQKQALENCKIVENLRNYAYRQQAEMSQYMGSADPQSQSSSTSATPHHSDSPYSSALAATAGAGAGAGAGAYMASRTQRTPPESPTQNPASYRNSPRYSSSGSPNYRDSNRSSYDDNDDSTSFNENERSALRERQPAPMPSMSVDPVIRQQLISYASIVIQELQAADASSGWQRQSSDSKKEVDIYTRETKDSPIHAFKGVGLIKCPPRQVFDAIRNPMFRYKYDNMLKRIRIVAEIDAWTQIVHMHHEARRCMLKTSRDFVFMTHGQEPQAANEPYIHVGRSVDFAPCPPVKGVTRAEIMSSGWIIKPANADGSWSHVTYVARVDIKGDIPSGLWNMIGKRQPLAIYYIRKQLEK